MNIFRNSVGRTVFLICVLIVVNGLASQYFFRWDLTSEKRYTLSSHSCELMSSLKQPLQVIFYLEGDLNPAFDRLRTSTLELLDELAQHTYSGITVQRFNPSMAPDELTRQANYLRMDQRGLRGISVNERDEEGKLSSKVIFPWMELIYQGDTFPVSLLKKSVKLSSQEVLNVSIGDLEYGLTEGIRLLTLSTPSRVAFIEGHGEFAEPYVYEATELLSRYYQVDRGLLSGDPNELLPYKLLIIASPQRSFTEAEKFALDQYLMSGGSVFWLIDGASVSHQEFDVTGESATLKPELNLDDLLFTYGVRINPVMVQDMQCSSIRVISSSAGAAESSVTLPWYFAPLLETSSANAITRNLSPVKSELVSTLSWVGTDTLHKSVLLSSSPHAHTLKVPEKVSLRYVEMPADPTYFNETRLPVAGLIEGRFRSAFSNRMLPSGATELSTGRLQQSSPTKIIVAASGSIIKNELSGQGEQTVALPLGYDVLSGQSFGNADFLANAANYLAGNDSWLNLRSRNYQLLLLNQQEVYQHRLAFQLLNVLAPLLFLLLTGFAFMLYRRRKYRC